MTHRPGQHSRMQATYVTGLRNFMQWLNSVQIIYLGAGLRNQIIKILDLQRSCTDDCISAPKWYRSLPKYVCIKICDRHRQWWHFNSGVPKRSESWQNIYKKYSTGIWSVANHLPHYLNLPPTDSVWSVTIISVLTIYTVKLARRHKWSKNLKTNCIHPRFEPQPLGLKSRI